MPRSKTEIDYWRSIWTNARRNMPRKASTNTGWAMLAFVLFGSQKLNMKVYNLSYFGRPPREPELQALLLKLAGPYGKVFARVVLQRRNVDPNSLIWE